MLLYFLPYVEAHRGSDLVEAHRGSNCHDVLQVTRFEPLSHLSTVGRAGIEPATSKDAFTERCPHQ